MKNLVFNKNLGMKSQIYTNSLSLNQNRPFPLLSERTYELADAKGLLVEVANGQAGFDISRRPTARLVVSGPSCVTIVVESALCKQTL